jgi:heme-degrading monooxygenase HmoA
MIVRTWTGVVKPGAALGYIAFLNDHMVPGIRSVAGNLGITILQGSGDLHDEFLVISRWMDLSSLVAFAGPDPEVAVVPEEAQALLSTWDDRAKHFEVALALAEGGQGVT